MNTCALLLSQASACYFMSRGGSRSTKQIFRALTNHYKDPILANFFLRHSQNFETIGQKGALCFFLKNFDQKIAFLRRVLPPQNYYILASKALLEKFRVHSAKNADLKIVQRMDPLDRQGVESLMGMGVPPLSLLVLMSSFFVT